MINIEKRSFFDLDYLRTGTYGTRLHIPFGYAENIYFFLNYNQADNLDDLEPYLDLGRFHPLLPPHLQRETALALCDLPRFEQIYRGASINVVTIGEPFQDLLDLLAH